jgi:hypothetical protein
MKLKFLKYGLLVTVLSLITMTGKSQLTINFNAPVYGQSLEGLSFVQVFNSSNEDVLINLTVKVSETNLGNVLTGKINSIPIKRGMNTIDRSAFSKGRFSFGNNSAGQVLSQTGRFPDGEFEYCFEAEIANSKSLWPVENFENCFVQQTQPLSPLLLINPADGEEACNVRPTFIWQLPMPLPADAKCRLILSEIKNSQDLAEAVDHNLPVINQGNITGNQLIYPGTAPLLKEGMRYAWQVTVYSGRTILKKSEIWEYHVKCFESIPDAAEDGYRELKESDDGNFYMADNILRFSFRNPYIKGNLPYTIVNLKNPSANITGLPKLMMLPGLNKYDLDLSDNKSFKNGEEYLLRVNLVNNKQFTLRFIFKKTEL